MRSGRRFPGKALRLLVAIGVLSILLGTSFALAASQDEQANRADTDLSASPVTDVAKEIPAQRTATSQTFELPSGAREVRLYQAPVYFRDEDGKLKPIEEGLEGRDGSALSNGDNSFDLSLPARLGAGPVRLSHDGAWVSSTLLGAPSAPVDLEEGTATYQLANPETSIELSSLPTGLKEDIEIAGPSASSTFHFELTASAGVTPTTAKDGAIEFRDQDDHLVARLPAPFMYDSSGAWDGFSNAVEYKLGPTDSGAWLLTVEASREWLQEPGRQFPVTIDPSMFGPHPAYFDCTVYSAPSIETWNKCAQNGVTKLAAEVYERASTPDEYSRTLAFFNLVGSSIPTTADVVSAEMHLYSGEAAKYTDGVELTRLTAPWSNYVSWKYSGYPNCYTCAPWATPGGTGSEMVGELTTAARPGGSAAGWWNIPLQEKMVQEWVNGSGLGNLGVAVKQLGEAKLGSCTPTCLYRQLSFESSAASNSSLRPYLGITYIPAAPATSKVISPTDGTRTAKRLKLQATWTSGVTGVTWQYREGKTGLFKTIPTELVRDGEGKAVSKWPVVAPESKTSDPLYLDAPQLSPTLRKKGGSVQIRALFEGGAPGYSAPVEAKLDPALGGPKDATAGIGPGTVDLLTGNLTVTKTDVSIPTFNSSLDFSRTFNSRDAGKLGDTGVLGQGWKPGVPVEENGAGEWSSVKVSEDSETIEGETYKFAWAEVIGIEGEKIPFEKEESGPNYITPDELSGWSLTKPSPSQFVLFTPDGTKTTFDNKEAPDPSEYLPVEVSQAGGPANSTRLTYQVVGTNRRLTQVVAPAAPGVNCALNPTAKRGCKVLAFNYKTTTEWGGPTGYGDRLTSISYYAYGFGGPWTVAEYKYDTTTGRLKEAWDPRISPALTEGYTYESTGQIATVTPPGLKPWTMKYGTLNEEEVTGRLLSVERDSLVAGMAKTTIAYGVPLSGSGLPSMTGSDVAKWDQKNVPVDATAIFPPDEVPTSSPPSSYSRALIYYLDSDGYEVNTAAPEGAGTEQASISTSEIDRYGNVVRELTPRNRIRALAEPEGKRIKAANDLSTVRVYQDEGTEMESEFGPLHSVRVKKSSGEGTEIKKARSYRYVEYDQVPPGVTLPSPAPHLPTTEKTAAYDEGALLEMRVNKTEYNWNLRKPTKTIVDAGLEAGDLNIESVTVYDESTGLPVERRQPSDAKSPGAGSTKITYWIFDHHPGMCSGQEELAGLPCLIEPVAQPGTSGMPQVKVTKFAAYNQLGQPTEVWEAPGKTALEAGAPRRTTVTTYDTAGRVKTVRKTGGGTTVPKAEILYSETTGAPVTQKFVCEPACEDDQAVTITYDALGRVTKYQDADGNTAESTYDLLDRPVTTSDGKGTQTRTYDPTSSLLVKLEDSAAGTFTASYDADGSLVAEGLPNGLVAEQTFNEAGQLTNLVYNKGGSIWLDFGAERSINGQIINQTGTTSNQEYSYDDAERLIQTKDTPASGNCVTRQYAFDKNSNRLSLNTREGIGSTCNTTSGGTEQKYEYDGADRLKGGGIAYDDYGRITSLPAVFAGGKALTTSYFSTDMVASQIQNGVTNTFQLDGALRQRQRTQGGGLEGVEVFHYADGSDTPAWTQLGAKWSRNIGGIGGGVSAIQGSSSETLLQLTNLHGDVVATATLNPSATKPVATFEHDEFGVPKLGGTQQFGWLGSQGRRTEFSSGVIQMGARSYVPSLGRFLSPDPILGGSANPYDYAGQDPVNAFDLTGTVCKKKNPNTTEGGCNRKQTKGERGVRKVVRNLRSALRKARSERTKRLVGVYPSDSPSITSAFEEEAHAAIGMATELLQDLDRATSCDAGQALASSGASWYTLKAVEGATKAARVAAAKLSAKFGIIASALAVADVLGFC
jgi:RHS repeat-associated protein